METTEKVDVYSLVTNRVIESLEQGIVPWQKSWWRAGIPSNLITERPYRGVNVLLLASLGYPNNYFLSFNQVQDINGMVKKGEKSCPVVYWKWTDQGEEENPEAKRSGELRYYNIFNVSQCEDITANFIPKSRLYGPDPVTAARVIIDYMPMCPDIKNTGQEASYDPKADCIIMPKIKSFVSREKYYEFLLRELIHSTGHESRLNRREVMHSSYGSANQLLERLTAEIGAGYLASVTGINWEEAEKPDPEYVEEWLTVLRRNKRLIVHASFQAQKATDYILNLPYGEIKAVEASEAKEEVPGADV